MFMYKQSTGEFFQDGKPLGHGYSGRGAGLNNPKMQNVAQTGPVPEGEYVLGEAGSDPKLGPEAIPLQPAATNQMFGRAGFYVHGDTSAQNHTASEGCIILSRTLRDRIAASTDKQLHVIP